MSQSAPDVIDTMPSMPVVDTSALPPLGADGATMVAHVAPNGLVDTVAVVIDVDGVDPIEVAVHDTNGDGVADVIAADLDGDGVLDLAEVDVDFDGQVDELVALSDLGDAILDSSVA